MQQLYTHLTSGITRTHMVAILLIGYVYSQFYQCQVYSECCVMCMLWEVTFLAREGMVFTRGGEQVFAGATEREDSR